MNIVFVYENCSCMLENWNQEENGRGRRWSDPEDEDKKNKKRAKNEETIGTF